MLQPTRLALAISMVGASFFSAAQAAEPPLRPRVDDDKGVYSFTFENDIVSGEDNNYSNGFRFAYVSPEGDVPGWLENTAALVPWFETGGHKRWGLAIGQSIYTPDNIVTTAPQPDDQPYAGWLYGTASLTSDTGTTLDTFQLTLGTVGPASGAEKVQEIVHDFLGADHPNGWQYQLHNEPGIVLGYERKWRGLYGFQPFGWGFDVTPTVSTQLGNIYTDATIGAIARFGQLLPEDYGPPLIRPSLSGSDFFLPTSSHEFGWYLFGGVEGTAVARNIFLDGNTFRNSPNVDKKNLVGGLQAGIAFTFDDMRLSYTHVLLTDRFEGQRSQDQYGAITLSLRF